MTTASWQASEGCAAELSAVFVCFRAAPWKPLIQPHGHPGISNQATGSGLSHALACRPIGLAASTACSSRPGAGNVDHYGAIMMGTQ